MGRMCVLALIALACWRDGVFAAEPAGATTSRRAREDAVRAIPFDQLEASDRNAVSSVIRNTTVYRRLPIKVIDCDPHLYLFMLRNPELITNIWQVMGVGEVSLQPIGEKAYRTSDGEGTSCDAKIVHDRFDKHVVFCRGSYNGSLFSSPIQSNCVLLLRTAYMREPNGRYYLTCQLDVFLQIERTSAAFLAKTFQPLLGRVADYNFTETMQFVGNLSKAAERSPEGAERLSQRLTRVDQDTRRQFVEMSYQVANRAQKNAELRRAGHVQAAERR